MKTAYAEVVTFAQITLYDLKMWLFSLSKINSYQGLLSLGHLSGQLKPHIFQC